MHRFLAIALLTIPLAATACTSTYHPDYHPVTVTSYEQHVSHVGYPADGNGVAAPGATLNAPPPPVPPPPPPWSAWPSE